MALAKPRSRGKGRRAPTVATLTALVAVDDPYEPGAKLVATVSLRDDILRQWHSRRAIDDGQFHAGRWFQALYEMAEIGASGAMRYDKPKVDGGYPLDPLTEKVLQARKVLRGIAGVLGRLDYPLLCRIVGEKVALVAEASSGAWGPGDAVRYVAKRVRQALEVLADHRGAVGPKRASMRSWLAGVDWYAQPVS